MDKQQLKQLRVQLEAEQARLESLIERTEKHLYTRDEPVSADFAEQAIETSNDEVVEALDGNAREELRAINVALQRMGSDAYGDCSKCGEPILFERLQAVPYTLYCAACARA